MRDLRLLPPAEALVPLLRAAPLPSPRSRGGKADAAASLPPRFGDPFALFGVALVGVPSPPTSSTTSLKAKLFLPAKLFLFLLACCCCSWGDGGPSGANGESIGFAMMCSKSSSSTTRNLTMLEQPAAAPSNNSAAGWGGGNGHFLCVCDGHSDCSVDANANSNVQNARQFGANRPRSQGLLKATWTHSQRARGPGQRKGPPNVACTKLR